MFDIIIKNGTVIDGTGKPMYKADVGIQEDKIKEIGNLQNERTEFIIDAQGHYVCPGFIDVNNHSDTYWRIFLNPDLESLIYQGITTIIGGNCGSSLAPLVSQETIQSIQKWADIKNINLNWLKLGEFLSEMEKRKISVNFATLVGHSTLRRGLIGDQTRSLNYHETRMMEKMLKNALKEGAIGLSTGLVYSHGKLAKEEEIIDLAKTIRKYNGVYTSHLRCEMNNLLDAVEEAVRTAQAAGVKLQISHLKAMGEKNWNLLDEALGMIEAASSSGLDVNFDIYPYTTTGSVLYILLPDWVSEGGKKMMIRRLKDPKIRTQVISEMKENNFDYSKIKIAISALDKTLVRKNISEIAATQGKTIEEAIIDILIASNGRVITNMEILSEKNVAKLIQHPLSIISSNGSGYNTEHKESGEMVHPRNFGTFPRVLAKYVKEEGILSWEEAINKMSGKPANKFGLDKRGIIKEGNFADVVILNPDEIQDLATQENPYQYSRGINWSLVNGKVILENGKYNGKREGGVIKR